MPSLEPHAPRGAFPRSATASAAERRAEVEEAVRSHEEEARVAESGADAARSLVRAASLAREELGDPQRAAELLARAVRAAPAEPEALRLLEALGEDPQAAEVTARTLEHLAAGARGRERAAHLVRAGRLYERALKARHRAVACWRLAARADPSCREAFAEERRVLGEDRRYVAVFASLERERATGAALAGEYAALGEGLVEEAALHGLARRALEAALALDPSHRGARATLETIEAAARRWREQVRALGTAGTEERDRKAAARSAFRVAQLFAAFEPTARAQRQEALWRSLLLWPGLREAQDLFIEQAEREQRLPEALAQLEKLVADHPDRALKIDLWIRAGALRLERLEDRAGALTAFERASGADPARPGPALLAFELYVESGREDEGWRLVDRHLAAIKDPPSAAEAHLRWAAVCIHLGRAERALVHLDAALAARPAHAEAAFLACRLSAAAGARDGLRCHLPAALRSERPEAERIALCAELARLSEAAGDAEGALAAWAYAVRVDPRQAAALARMVDQAAASGVAASLVAPLQRAAAEARGEAAEVLARELSRVASAADAAAHREQPAPAPEHERTRLEAQLRLAEAGGDPESVLSLHRRLVALAPDDAAVLERFTAACSAHGRWGETAATLERLASIAGGPDARASHRVRLAQVRAEQLGQPGEAAALLLTLLAESQGRAVERNRVATPLDANAPRSGSTAALAPAVVAQIARGLERLLWAGVRREELSRALLDHYVRQGDHQRAATVLQMRLAGPLSPEEKKEVLRRLAELEEHRLADGRSALSRWLEGVAVDPSDASFRAEAARLARDLLAHAEVARAWAELAAGTPDPQVAHALRIEAADLAEQGGALAAAERCLVAALEVEPDHPPLLDRLVRLYRQADRLSEAERTLRRRILLAEPEEKPALYLELVELNRKLSSPRAAAQALEQAIRAGAPEAEHVEALCELLERAGQTRELAVWLERRAELAERRGEGDRAARARLRRAHLLEGSPHDRGEAVRTYGEILTTRPADPEALAGLEQLLSDPACREEAALALVPALQAAGEPRRLAAALEILAQCAQDDVERLLALRRVAHVHLEQLGEPQPAFDALIRALGLAPADAELHAEARRAAERAGRLRALAERLEELLASTPAAQPILQRELARTCEWLDDAAGAIRHWRALSAATPRDVEVLSELRRLLLEAEDWPGLAEVVERIAAATAELGAQLGAWRQAADLYEGKLADKPRALECLRQIVERSPTDGDAAARLERLASELSHPAELALALERLCALEGGGARRRDLAARLAAVRAEGLGEPASAVVLAREVLEADPAHPRALEVLEPLVGLHGEVGAQALAVADGALSQRREHERRVSLREARLDVADPAERARLAAEVRSLCENELGQKERAFMAGLKAFAEGLDLDHLEPELERLAAETDSIEELAEIFESAAAELPRGGPRRAGLWRRAAGLRERLLDEDAEARDLDALLDELPGDAFALSRLVRLLRGSTRARERVEAAPPEARPAALRALARIRDEAGEPGAALEAWRALLQVSPKDPEALEALEPLLREARAWDELARVLEVRQAGASGEQERISAGLRRADALERAGKLEDASRALREVVLAPNGGAVASPDEGLAALDRLLGKLGRSREQAEVLARRLERVASDEEARELSVRRAEALDAAGEVDAALGAFGQILERWPLESRAVAGLERLLRADAARQEAALRLEAVYRSQGDRSKSIELLELRLEGEQDRNARRPLLEELATLREAGGELSLAFAVRRRLFAEWPGDERVRAELIRIAEKAGAVEDLIAAFEDQLERDPRAPSALELWRALARLHREASRTEPLVQALLGQAEVEPTDSARADCLFEAAELAESALGDVEVAIRCYRAVLARQPGDRAALRSLQAVLRAAGRRAEEAEVLAQELRAAQAADADGEAQELELALARRRLELGELDPAFDSLRRLLDTSGREAAVQFLEPLALGEAPALSSATRSRAAALLEPVLDAAGEHGRAVRLLEVQAELSSSKEDRAAVLVRAARVCAERLGDPSRALLIAARALRERPDSAELVAECVQLARRAEAGEELAALLEELAPEVEDAAARARLYRALAEAQESVGDRDAAIASWRGVMEAAPGDDSALEHGEALLRAEGRSHELAELLRARLSSARSDPERQALLRRIAAAQEAAGAAGAAVDSLRQALALGSTVEVLEALELLLGRMGRHGEQAEVLGRLVEQAPEAERRRELLLRRAEALSRAGMAEASVEAFAQGLGEHPYPEAVSGLERLLDTRGGRYRAAVLLEPIYRARGELRGLVKVLEIQLTAAPDPERPRLFEELARCREALGDKPQAFSALLAAFASAPDREPLRAELERLADQTGSAARLAEEYRAILEQELSPPTSLALWRRLAALYGGGLGRPELAARAWEEVLARSERDPEALEALATLYRTAGEVRSLVRVLEQLAASAESTERAIVLFEELAALADERLADVPLALRFCREILTRNPDHPGAAERLEQVLSESEQYAELAEHLDQRVAHARALGRADEALELCVRRARVQVLHLGEAGQALATAQEVLERRPKDPGAISVLEELLRSNAPERARAGALLAPLFEAAGDAAGQVEALEAQAEGADPPARADLLLQAAELLAGPLHAPHRAFAAAARALRERPEDRRALELCRTLAPAAAGTTELVRLLDGLASDASDGEVRHRLARAAAELHEALGQRGEAIDSWRMAADCAPDDAEALRRLEALLAQQGRVREQVEVLRRELALVERSGERSAARDLLERIGVLEMDRLDHAEAALETFRKLSSLAPEHPLALERLDTLCHSLGHFREQEEVLERRLRLADPESARELKFRLGHLREVHLGDRWGALALYREVLAGSPRHPGALAQVMAIFAQALASPDTLPEGAERKAAWVELAEVLAEQGEQARAFEASSQAFLEEPADAVVADRLSALATAAGRHESLATVYERALEQLAGLEGAKLALTLGRLCEGPLDDPERAASAYARARAFDPSADADALPALARLYESLSRFAPLAEVLEASAARAPSPEERAALLARLGAVAQDRLEQPERAAAALAQVVTLAPSDFDSLRRLVRVHRSAGEPKKLVDALALLSERTTGAEREQALLEMSELAEAALADPERAVALARQVLSDDPRSEPGFARLEALLARGDRYEELKDLLSSKLSLELDPARSARLHLQLAEVLWKKLGRPDDAVAHYEATLEREPRNAAALSALRELYEAANRREDLAEVLGRLAELRKGSDALEVRLRWGEVLLELGRRAEALASVQPCLTAPPRQEPALERLYRLFASAEAHGEAATVQLLRAEVALEGPEVARAVSLLLEASELWRKGETPLDGAAALERILELDPGHREAQKRALALYAEHGAWAAYARRLERFFPALENDGERRTALEQLADAQESGLGDKPAALATLCRALRLTPEDAPLRVRLLRLADEAGGHRGLAETWQEVADAALRGPLAAELYLGLSQLYDQKLDAPEEAASVLRKVLEFDPAHVGALDALASLFERRGRDREYVAALEQKCEVVSGVEERKALYREIARVHDERLGDPNAADAALRRSLDLAADSETFAARVELLQRHGRWREAAQALLASREVAAPEARVGLQLAAARLYEEKVGEAEAAVAIYREALVFEPTCREALDALERLYGAQGRFPELLRIHERQLEAARENGERVALHLKAARLLEERLKSPSQADAHLEAVLALDERHPEALRGLERIRRASRRWEPLVQVLERKARLAGSADAGAAAWVEAGEVLHKELKDPRRAAEAYQRALEADPRCRAAVSALAGLHERAADWPKALELLRKEAELADSAAEAAELHVRAARIHAEVLFDRAQAKAGYREALRLDPTRTAALRGLRAIAEQERDWARAEELLMLEVEHTPEASARSAVQLELGRHFAQRRHDLAAARRWYEEALASAPGSLEAALPLADMAIERQDWGAAEAMLELVTAALAQRSPARAESKPSSRSEASLARELHRLGQARRKLGRREKAVEALEQSARLDPRLLGAVQELAEVRVELGHWKEAADAYQTLLSRHRAELSDQAALEAHCRLGEVHLNLQQPDRAQLQFERALSLRPAHAPALRAMAGLAERAGRFRSAATYLDRLSHATEGEVRFDACVELGKLARAQLGDPSLAIEAFGRALQVKNDAVPVIEALYEAYRAAGQAQSAARTLESLLSLKEIQADPLQRRQVHFRLGELATQELKEVDRAAAAFNAALDVDFRFEEAFSGLRKLLESNRRWRQLDEAYLRMIQRVASAPDAPALKARYFREQAELRAGTLRDAAAALESFRSAAACAPGDASLQEALGRHAAAIPGAEATAIGAFREALPASAHPEQVVSALLDLSLRQRDADGAYLAAQTLFFLGQSGQSERGALTRFGPLAALKELAERPLPPELWRRQLLHPALRGPLGELMAALAVHAGPLWAVPHGDLELKPKRHRVDPALFPHNPVVRDLAFVARFLGMESVELFSPYLMVLAEGPSKRAALPDPELDAMGCPTAPPSVKLGGRFFAQRPRKERLAAAAVALAAARPELVLAQVEPPRLQLLVDAAIGLFRDHEPPELDPKVLKKERKRLEKELSHPGRAALEQAVHRYLPTAAPGDVSTYVQAAELTAARVALLVAGDLEAVRRVVLEPASSRIPRRARVMDLVVFACSGELASLRAAVGLQVEINP